MRLGELYRRISPSGYDKYAYRQRLRQRKRISEALAVGHRSPWNENDERLFETLQARAFPVRNDQRFDELSSWTRAAERVAAMIRAEVVPSTRIRVFEGSCGDGLTGYLMREMGCDVVLNDFEDWRHPKARALSFIRRDLCQRQALGGESFDLLYSYNAFEHLPDPAAAVGELVRLCKPGGYIYLDFGPIYCSPWGLHAWCFNFPYPQFLFSRDFITSKVAQLGVEDLGTNRTQLQPTNGWRIGAYRQLWGESGCTIAHVTEDVDFRYLDFIEEFATAFAGRGLSLEDLTVNSIQIVLRKPDKP